MRDEAVQLQVREELLYHRRFENGRDDLELTAAVRAMLKVDLEYPFEQPGPADARRRPCVQPDSVAVSSDSPVTSSGAWGTPSAHSFE